VEDHRLPLPPVGVHPQHRLLSHRPAGQERRRWLAEQPSDLRLQLRGRARYDVILDNVGNRPLSRLRRALTPTGTLVLNGGGSPGHVFGPVAGILRAVVVNGLVRERLRLIPHAQKREQLLTLTGLIEAGKLTPVLDRTYPLAGTAEGLRRVEQGHARGKVVITVA
jgi:NADPH:quinone reductase-like Zn-dependent oxidoreductase